MGILLKIIRFYQIFISPILGKNCRFYPSCSNYAAGSILKYGTKKGIWKGLRRIIRCHPLNSGGIDLP